MGKSQPKQLLQPENRRASQAAAAGTTQKAAAQRSPKHSVRLARLPRGRAAQRPPSSVWTARTARHTSPQRLVWRGSCRLGLCNCRCRWCMVAGCAIAVQVGAASSRAAAVEATKQRLQQPYTVPALTSSQQPPPAKSREGEQLAQNETQRVGRAGAVAAGNMLATGPILCFNPAASPQSRAQQQLGNPKSSFSPGRQLARPVPCSFKPNTRLTPSQQRAQPGSGTHQVHPLVSQPRHRLHPAWLAPLQLICFRPASALPGPAAGGKKGMRQARWQGLVGSLVALDCPPSAEQGGTDCTSTPHANLATAVSMRSMQCTRLTPWPGRSHLPPSWPASGAAPGTARGGQASGRMSN